MSPPSRIATFLSISFDSSPNPRADIRKHAELLAHQNRYFEQCGLILMPPDRAADRLRYPFRCDICSKPPRELTPAAARAHLRSERHRASVAAYLERRASRDTATSPASRGALSPRREILSPRSPRQGARGEREGEGAGGGEWKGEGGEVRTELRCETCRIDFTCELLLRNHERSLSHEVFVLMRAGVLKWDVTGVSRGRERHTIECKLCGFEGHPETVGVRIVSWHLHSPRHKRAVEMFQAVSSCTDPEVRRLDQ